MMPYRILHYIVKIWDQWIKEQDDDARMDLPPICPLVLYHGKQPWRATSKLTELVGINHLAPGTQEA